jgi:alpha(1,3/1,4) fucosyltransferase
MLIKNIGYWTREDKLLRNNYFAIGNNQIDLDQNIIQNWLVPFGLECKKKNISINNLNLIKNINDLDLLIVADFPGIKNQTSLLKKGMCCKRKILIIEENPTVYPETWSNQAHNQFDYILTMCDDKINNKKYFKYNFPCISMHENLFPLNEKINFKEKKFSCMISWNKVYEKKSNTSFKIKIIRWFENNYPDQFDLYGPNWDEKVFSYKNPLTKYLNQSYFKVFRKFLGDFYPSWKGNIDAKIKKQIINKYKFIFVLENSSEYNGYITDKIFETFLSGSVPVYLGSKNIDKFIPESCFINLKNFKNLNDLYFVLNSINEEEYNFYLKNIKDYLHSDKSKIFKTEQLNKTLFEIIDLYNL